MVTARDLGHPRGWSRLFPACLGARYTRACAALGQRGRQPMWRGVITWQLRCTERLAMVRAMRRWLSVVLVLGCAGGCAGNSPPPGGDPDAPAGPGSDGSMPGEDAAEVRLDPTPGSYLETCDGSGAIAVDFLHFLDVNDENQGMRLYRRATAAAPVQQLDISTALGLTAADEADLEDVARVGQRIYVITSHGRNNNGELRLARYRFAAFDLAGSV